MCQIFDYLTKEREEITDLDIERIIAIASTWCLKKRLEWSNELEYFCDADFHIRAILWHPENKRFYVIAYLAICQEKNINTFEIIDSASFPYQLHDDWYVLDITENIKTRYLQADDFAYGVKDKVAETIWQSDELPNWLPVEKDYFYSE